MVPEFVSVADAGTVEPPCMYTSKPDNSVLPDNSDTVNVPVLTTSACERPLIKPAETAALALLEVELTLIWPALVQKTRLLVPPP